MVVVPIKTHHVSPLALLARGDKTPLLSTVCRFPDSSTAPWHHSEPICRRLIEHKPKSLCLLVCCHVVWLSRRVHAMVFTDSPADWNPPRLLDAGLKAFHRHLHVSGMKPICLIQPNFANLSLDSGLQESAALELGSTISVSYARKRIAYTLLYVFGAFGARSNASCCHSCGRCNRAMIAPTDGRDGGGQKGLRQATSSSSDGWGFESHYGLVRQYDRLLRLRILCRASPARVQSVILKPSLLVRSYWMNNLRHLANDYQVLQIPKLIRSLSTCVWFCLARHGQFPMLISELTEQLNRPVGEPAYDYGAPKTVE
jgi:hypothetical protein